MSKKLELDEMELFYLRESLKVAIRNHEYIYHSTKITNNPDKLILEKQKIELRNLLSKLGD